LTIDNEGVRVWPISNRSRHFQAAEERQYANQVARREDADEGSLLGKKTILGVYPISSSLTSEKHEVLIASRVR
jgi:hypothetical protein